MLQRVVQCVDAVPLSAAPSIESRVRAGTLYPDLTGSGLYDAVCHSTWYSAGAAFFNPWWQVSEF